MIMKVYVTYVNPPIPQRSWDYQAHDDDTFDEGCCTVGRGETPAEAVLDLIYNTDNLWPDSPSFELCSDVNPALWQAYCHLMGRMNAPSSVWTEHDVVVHIDLLADQFWKAKSNV
jgi:hypothetical protein